MPEVSSHDEFVPPLESVPIGSTSWSPYHSWGLVSMDHSASVGDSPRGPLKQLGNPNLKPAASQNQTRLA
jgi:hypothetical protein